MSAEPALRRAEGCAEVTLADGRLLAVLRRNDWETAFFGRLIGSLELDGPALCSLAPAIAARAVALAAEAADGAGYRLVQAHLDLPGLALAAPLEQAGFRLVDTRVEFLTRLDRRTAPRHTPPCGEIVLAGPEHRDALLALAHEGLTKNPEFRSRYKDRGYFTPEESTRWFTAWVDRDLATPAALVAMWLVAGAPAAFLGLGPAGHRADLPLYKSSLAVAAAAYRGHKAHMFLQTALFAALPHDEFWMHSVTQLGNTPVIRNNFALGRRLERIALAFFRREGAAAA